VALRMALLYLIAGRPKRPTEQRGGA